MLELNAASGRLREALDFTVHNLSRKSFGLDAPGRCSVPGKKA